MSYVDEGQRSRRGFAAGRSGKGIFRGALYLIELLLGKTRLVLMAQLTCEVGIKLSGWTAL
jgi:hypothetical protein